MAAEVPVRYAIHLAPRARAAVEDGKMVRLSLWVVGRKRCVVPLRAPSSNKALSSHFFFTAALHLQIVFSQQQWPITLARLIVLACRASRPEAPSHRVGSRRPSMPPECAWPPPAPQLVRLASAQAIQQPFAAAPSKRWRAGARGRGGARGGGPLRQQGRRAAAGVGRARHPVRAQPLRPWLTAVGGGVR